MFWTLETRKKQSIDTVGSELRETQRGRWTSMSATVAMLLLGFSSSLHAQNHNNRTARTPLRSAQTAPGHGTRMSSTAGARPTVPGKAFAGRNGTEGRPGPTDR